MSGSCDFLLGLLSGQLPVARIPEPFPQAPQAWSESVRRVWLIAGVHVTVLLASGGAGFGRDTAESSLSGHQVAEVTALWVRLLARYVRTMGRNGADSMPCKLPLLGSAGENTARGEAEQLSAEGPSRPPLGQWPASRCPRNQQTPPRKMHPPQSLSTCRTHSGCPRAPEYKPCGAAGHKDVSLGAPAAPWQLCTVPAHREACEHVLLTGLGGEGDQAG